MTYPFVAAKWFTAGAILQYRGIVIHMAEGGGTVGYLAKVTRDVSASHVIEYSGRIVQMVKDGDASHCQHVSPEPYTTSDYGIYSSAIGKVVLLEGWSNVNRYVFAVEIEGFRAAGPNAAQAASLKALVADLRSRFPTIRGLLGHRDIQDKPCPGGLIPWAQIGGHGLFAEEDEVIKAIKGEDWTPTVTNGTSNGVFRESPDRAAPIAERVGVDVVIRTIAEISAGGLSWRVTERMGKVLYMLRTDWNPLVPGGDPVVDQQLTDYIAQKVAPLPDCSAEVLAEFHRMKEGTTATVNVVFPEPPV